MVFLRLPISFYFPYLVFANQHQKRRGTERKQVINMYAYGAAIVCGLEKSVALRVILLSPAEVVGC